MLLSELNEVRNGLKNTSNGCEQLKCIISADSGWISSTLCTFDLSPKVNFTLYVLYTSLWSRVMVG